MSTPIFDLTTAPSVCSVTYFMQNAPAFTSTYQCAHFIFPYLASNRASRIIWTARRLRLLNTNYRFGNARGPISYLHRIRLGTLHKVRKRVCGNSMRMILQSLNMDIDLLCRIMRTSSCRVRDLFIRMTGRVSVAVNVLVWVCIDYTASTQAIVFGPAKKRIDSARIEEKVNNLLMSLCSNKCGMPRTALRGQDGMGNVSISQTTPSTTTTTTENSTTDHHTAIWQADKSRRWQRTIIIAGGARRWPTHFAPASICRQPTGVVYSLMDN